MDGTFLSNTKIEFNDGNNYKGIDMMPDIFVKNNLIETLSAVDKTLETVLEQF
jgi:hypothetical protein